MRFPTTLYRNYPDAWLPTRRPGSIHLSQRGIKEACGNSHEEDAGLTVRRCTYKFVLSRKSSTIGLSNTRCFLYPMTPCWCCAQMLSCPGIGMQSQWPVSGQFVAVCAEAQVGACSAWTEVDAEVLCSRVATSRPSKQNLGHVMRQLVTCLSRACFRFKVPSRLHIEHASNCVRSSTP